MKNSWLRTNKELEEVYGRHVEAVYRVCWFFLRNPADTEDAVQTVFLRFLEKAPPFQEEGHCRAWLLVTASNVSKNVLRRKRVFPVESPEEAGLCLWGTPSPEVPWEPDGTLERLLRLPFRYKEVLYLYYYEGYSCEETARLLGKNSSTVRSLLRRGREKLKLEMTAGKDGWEQ